MSDRPPSNTATPASRPWWRRVGTPVWMVVTAVVTAAVVLVVIAPGKDSSPADGNGSTTADNTAVRGPISGIERRQDEDPVALGRKDAPVVMVEYSDLRCPFCARHSRETHPELIRRYVDTGVLRIEWRDFPIFGKQSETAAHAGRAAARQGRFWEFQKALFADAPLQSHPKLSKEKLIAFARIAKMPDLARFERDMGDGQIRQAVDADRDQGLGIGVSSTPSFIINGTPVIGAQPLEAFVTAIEQAQGNSQ